MSYYPILGSILTFVVIKKNIAENEQQLTEKCDSVQGTDLGEVIVCRYIQFLQLRVVWQKGWLISNQPLVLFHIPGNEITKNILWFQSAMTVGEWACTIRTMAKSCSCLVRPLF